MGFFKWFKNSAKMKRWMLIILTGIVLACIGISKIMVAKTISFTGIGKVIALFVVGFTMVIIGLVYSQKRVLEILVEDTDYRMDNGSKEIRDLTNEEITKKIEEYKEELFNLRFSQATGTLEKPARIKELRKLVARMKTVLRERELNN